ncbi:MAG: hypothetical protein ACK5PQ_02320 [Alphaproteobacteria bacterium]
MTSDSENEDSLPPLVGPVKARKWSFFRRAHNVAPQAKQEGASPSGYRRFSFNTGRPGPTKVMVLPADSSFLAPRSYSWSREEKPRYGSSDRLSLPQIREVCSSGPSLSGCGAPVRGEGEDVSHVPTAQIKESLAAAKKKLVPTQTLNFKTAAEKALLWVNDQHILVLDDTTLKKFLSNQASTGARFKAILVDSGFGHLTETQWKKFSEAFRQLNLDEVQEFVIKKQPKNSVFLKLLQERKQDMPLLQAVGFSEGVLDRGNAKILKDILKKISSLKYLSFGQMEGNKTEIRALYKIHDGKGLVEFTGDTLREAWFPRLRTILKS